jgi:hypothetical protein
MVEAIAADTSSCETEEENVFSIIPRALSKDYDNQSLGEWLAGYTDELTREDEELFCTLIAECEEEDVAILDMACNLMSPTVLDELVYTAPGLISSEELLLNGYGGGGLLQNQALSGEALTYLSGLLLDLPLPEDFAGCTKGYLRSFAPSQSDVRSYQEEYQSFIDELDADLVRDAIADHPNCPETIKKQL